MSSAEWNRREFMTALGAGMVAKTLPGPWLLRLRNTIKIRFAGAMLLRTSPTGSAVEFLVPLAQGPGHPEYHPDMTRAHEHFAILRPTDQNGDPTGSPLSLLHDDLQISVDQSIPQLYLDNMFDLAKFTTDTSVREYDQQPERFSCRVTLQGGTLRTYVEDFGKWAVGSEAPRKPVTYLEWDSGLPRVEVKRKQGAPVVLDANQVGGARISHEPHPIPDYTVKRGFTARDFKWLYRLVIPRGTASRNNPWALKHLVVPRCEEPPPPPYVGSPTCFGGCFGCT